MAAGNYAAVGGAAITLTSAQNFGYLGYKYYSIVTAADNQGIYFTTSTMANAIHYLTLRVHTSSDLTPMFDVSADNVTFAATTLLGQEGDFYVYGRQIPAAQCSGNSRIYVQQNGAGGGLYKIAHVQLEQSTYPTTPITGDRKGFTENGYHWNGEPNASSSTRSAMERSGGVVTDLETSYNFRVLYGDGTGMPPIQHHVQGMALLPGALYQGHKVLPRILDLVSATTVRTAATVAAARRDFINAVKIDRVTPEQPIVFRYSANSIRPVDFHAFYDSGMEFQTTVGVIDKPVVRLICYDPFCYDLQLGNNSFTTRTSLANADEVVGYVDHVWKSISTDFAAEVDAIVRGNDGGVYIGGLFTNVGDANGDYIVKYDPFTGTVSSLGTGMNGNVYALLTAPNGDIYAGGAFTLAGGVANTARIAYWDVSASVWVPLSTGFAAGSIYALAFGNDGTLYIGGSFTNQGDANGDYIVSWNGSAWASLGAGMDSAVHALAVAPNGDLYAAGLFTTAGGTSAAGIAKWNGSAWSALGTGLTGGLADGYALAIDKAGNVYVGGSFTAANGVSCAYIGKWNGSTFEPLGSGVNATVENLAFDRNGMLYAGGAFTLAGGVSLSDRVAMWNGTTWNHLDIDLPGSPGVYSLLTSKTNDDLYLGYDTTGTAYVNTTASVTNSGSSSAYPIIKVKRSGGAASTLQWIKNLTTGYTLWFDYDLLDGETLTIDLTPGNKSVKSSVFGDVWRALLRSSDLAKFCLLPGTNSIGVFCNPVDSSVAVWMEYPNTHWGSDQVAA
jgi:hypothetical protein